MSLQRLTLRGTDGLDDLDVELQLDRGRKLVTLHMLKFNSELVGQFLAEELPQAYGIRVDDDVFEHALTTSRFDLVIALAGRRHPASLHNRGDGRVAVLLGDPDALHPRGSRAGSPLGSRSPEKVLFLDFDGVLHSEAVFWHPRRGAYLQHSLVADGRRLFENAPLLEELLEPYPDVRIVLSTTWVVELRYSRAVARLTPSLQARCVGATFHRREMEMESFKARPRGRQVLDDIGRRKPLTWLALDDTDEGWPDAERSNVIITHPVLGIGAPATRAQLVEALKRFR